MTSPEPRERTIELPVIRWWPRTLWVRIGVSLTGEMDPAWKPHYLYMGVVGRLAWPLIAGRGPYLLWLRKEPRDA